MKLTYRKDYKAPAYRILTTDLNFTLDEEKTIVKSHLNIEKIKDEDLVLNGSRLSLISISLNGKKLSENEYELTENALILKNLPDTFELDIQTQINPKAKIVCDEQRLRPEKSEVNRLLGKNEKILRLTNWKPQYTFEEGIKETIEFIKENMDKYKPDIYNL